MYEEYRFRRTFVPSILNSEASSAMKMASTSTDNKRFTARHRAGLIFMQGGAPTAHEVLSECGFLPFGQRGTTAQGRKLMEG
jgi:hypothetical protein